MEYLIAAVLGAVQGLTEFLPISSDGHLFVIREILGWPDQGLAFDAVLHIGTLAAVLVGLWPQWKLFLKGLLSMVRERRLWSTPEQRLVTLVVIATIPAVVVGLLFEDLFANTFRTLLSVALWFAATGTFYFFAESLVQKTATRRQPTRWGSLLIGLAQTAALLPGVSRSGLTIATGSLLGLSRSDAATFSFVLSGPVVLGASILSAVELVSSPAERPADSTAWLALVLGVVVAFVVGLFAIRSLLRFLRTNTLRPFGTYLLTLAGMLLLAHAFGML